MKTCLDMRIEAFWKLEKIAIAKALRRGNR